MESTFWIMVSALILIVILLIFAILYKAKNKGKIPKRDPDYYSFFWMGICWLGAGIPLAVTTNNWGLLGIGIIFTIWGLAHKKEWKKNHIKHKDLTPAERKIKSWIAIILGIIVLVGLVAFLFIRGI